MEGKRRGREGDGGREGWWMGRARERKGGDELRVDGGTGEGKDGVDGGRAGKGMSGKGKDRGNGRTSGTGEGEGGDGVRTG